MGYEVLRDFPDDLEVMNLTLQDGTKALFALRGTQGEDYDLSQKVRKLLDDRDRIIQGRQDQYHSKIQEF